MSLLPVVFGVSFSDNLISLRIKPSGMSKNFKCWGIWSCSDCSTFFLLSPSSFLLFFFFLFYAVCKFKNMAYIQNVTWLVTRQTQRCWFHSFLSLLLIIVGLANSSWDTLISKRTKTVSERCRAPELQWGSRPAFRSTVVLTTEQNLPSFCLEAENTAVLRLYFYIRVLPGMLI